MVSKCSLDKGFVIEKIKETPGEKYLKPNIDTATFYLDTIGVSKMPNQTTQTIVLKMVKEHAPYIITKPMHPSQKILKEDTDGVIFSIDVIWNFELEREILGFGEQIKILSPKRLSGKIQSRLKQTLHKYQNI